MGGWKVGDWGEGEGGGGGGGGGQGERGIGCHINY